MTPGAVPIVIEVCPSTLDISLYGYRIPTAVVTEVDECYGVIKIKENSLEYDVNTTNVSLAESGSERSRGGKQPQIVTP